MIKEIKKERVDATLVKMMETVLEDVKKGDIVAVGMALRFCDGESGTCFAGWRVNELIKPLRIMERDIIDTSCELRLHKKGEFY